MLDWVKKHWPARKRQLTTDDEIRILQEQLGRDRAFRSLAAVGKGQLLHDMYMNDLLALERERIWRVESWEEYMKLKGEYEYIRNLLLALANIDERIEDTIQSLTQKGEEIPEEVQYV